MKRLPCVISLVVLSFLTFSCQNKAEKAELEAMRAQKAIEEKNREFVKGYFEELNKGNIEIINETCSPDYGFYNPSNKSEPLSREGIAETLRNLFKAFPDINWRIEKLVVSGDIAVIWNIVTGTHQGDLQGIPATGKKVEFSSILMWTIKDGKIVEEREEANMLGLMMQLGMELRPKGVRK